jgi:hypothetical protein
MISTATIALFIAHIVPKTAAIEVIVSKDLVKYSKNCPKGPANKLPKKSCNLRIDWLNLS